jgi:hypothetical protein
VRVVRGGVDEVVVAEMGTWMDPVALLGARHAWPREIYDIGSAFTDHSTLPQRRCYAHSPPIIIT